MRKTHKMWRIVEKHEKGLKTLFHGVNGSRILPQGKWLKAEKKLASEGSGRKYISAFPFIIIEAIIRGQSSNGIIVINPIMIQTDDGFNTYINPINLSGFLMISG
jgi:hypothetical protein